MIPAGAQTEREHDLILDRRVLKLSNGESRLAPACHQEINRWPTVPPAVKPPRTISKSPFVLNLITYRTGTVTLIW